MKRSLTNTQFPQLYRITENSAVSPQPVIESTQNIVFQMHMLKIPLCPYSHKQCVKVCASSACRTNPFICKYCHNGCIDRHLHNGGPMLSFKWSDIESDIHKAVQDNGFVYPEIDSIFDRVQAVVEKLKATIQLSVNNLKKLKLSAVVKEEYRKTLKKMKSNQADLLTGQQVGSLLSAIKKSELLENKQELSQIVTQKLFKLNTILDDVDRRLNQQQEEEKQNARQLIKKGEELRMQKKWKQAIAVFTQALTIDKSSDLTLFCRGYAYDQMKDYNKAIEQYNKAIQINHTNPSYFNNRGIAYKNLGKYHQAVQDYTKAIALNGAHSDYFFNRAIVYKTLGHHQKAIEDYNKAIDLSPTNAEYYNGRGISHKTNKDLNSAIQDYCKAINLNANNPDFYFNRGIAYAMEKNYEKALGDFNKAIEIDPNEPQNYKNRAIIYEKLGKNAEAAHDKQKMRDLQVKK